MDESKSRCGDSVITPWDAAGVEPAQIWDEEENAFRITDGNCLSLCPSGSPTSSKGIENSEFILLKQVPLAD